MQTHLPFYLRRLPYRVFRPLFTLKRESFYNLINQKRRSLMAKDQKQEQQPPQHQARQPGLESEMTPKPEAENPSYRGSGKLKNKVALITGGDSGIGRAVAIAYAK